MTPTDPCKYIIYARKSTEDEGSQVNSIKDQVAICTEYAKRTGKKVIDTVTEEKSAKYPDRRPKFKKMIERIKRGEADGIISYHPDRLARNMLDAGRVIDLLNTTWDKKDAPLKSLAFPTVEFNNDSGGRLTLAVLFSLATNYSDHLSEMVQRGVTTNLLERGLSAGTPKWGYVRDEITGCYQPDSNYDTVRAAWDIILSGGTQKAAIEYMQSMGVARTTKITRKNKRKRVIPIGKDTTLFRDPFYYGELCQGGQTVDLNKMQPNFKPMISKEEYVKAQKMLGMKGARMALSINRKGRDFLPLRQFVTCQACGSTMYVAASKGMGGLYVYYTCKNPDCPCKNKGIRANVIFEAMYKLLDTIKPDDSDFENYQKSLDEYIEIELADLTEECASLRGKLSQLKAKKKHADEQYLAVVAQGDKAPKGATETAAGICNDIQGEIDNVQNDISDIEQVINDPELVKLSKEEFSNLLKNAARKVKAGDLVQKDQIARLLFSNIEIDTKKAPHFLCNPEFEGLLGIEKIDFGAPD